MDVVEFAEKFMGIELFECQKDLLRKIEKLGPEDSIRVVTGRFRQPYIYPTQAILKELTQNVQTPNNRN